MRTIFVHGSDFYLSIIRSSFSLVSIKRSRDVEFTSSPLRALAVAAAYAHAPFCAILGPLEGTLEDRDGLAQDIRNFSGPHSLIFAYAIKPIDHGAYDGFIPPLRIIQADAPIFNFLRNDWEGMSARQIAEKIDIEAYR